MKNKEKYVVACGGIQPIIIPEIEKSNNKFGYVEPADYFPKEFRKEYKLGEYADTPHLDKIKAVMLGHAVGDALGVPVEFCERVELEEILSPICADLALMTFPQALGRTIPRCPWLCWMLLPKGALDTIK